MLLGARRLPAAALQATCAAPKCSYVPSSNTSILHCGRCTCAQSLPVLAGAQQVVPASRERPLCLPEAASQLLLPHDSGTARLPSCCHDARSQCGKQRPPAASVRRLHLGARRERCAVEQGRSETSTAFCKLSDMFGQGQAEPAPQWR